MSNPNRGSLTGKAWGPWIYASLGIAGLVGIIAPYIASRAGHYKNGESGYAIILSLASNCLIAALFVFLNRRVASDVVEVKHEVVRQWETFLDFMDRANLKSRAESLSRVKDATLTPDGLRELLRGYRSLTNREELRLYLDRNLTLVLRYVPYDLVKSLHFLNSKNDTTGNPERATFGVSGYTAELIYVGADAQRIKANPLMTLENLENLPTFLENIAKHDLVSTDQLGCKFEELKDLLSGYLVEQGTSYEALPPIKEVITEDWYLSFDGQAPAAIHVNPPNSVTYSNLDVNATYDGAVVPEIVKNRVAIELQELDHLRRMAALHSLIKQGGRAL